MELHLLLCCSRQRPSPRCESHDLGARLELVCLSEDHEDAETDVVNTLVSLYQNEEKMVGCRRDLTLERKLRVLWSMVAASVPGLDISTIVKCARTSSFEGNVSNTSHHLIEWCKRGRKRSRIATEARGRNSRSPTAKPPFSPSHAKEVATKTENRPRKLT